MSLESIDTVSAPSRLTQRDRETYRRDGVVHLKGAFSAEWLDLLGRGIDRNMAAPSPRFEARTMEGSDARYCETSGSGRSLTSSRSSSAAHRRRNSPQIS